MPVLGDSWVSIICLFLLVGNALLLLSQRRIPGRATQWFQLFFFTVVFMIILFVCAYLFMGGGST